MLVYMPYKLIKTGRNWSVQDVKSGRVFSKTGMPKKQAIAQKTAIIISEARRKK